MKMNLKKAISLGFVFMICTVFLSPAMAKNEPGLVGQPANFLLVGGPIDQVCFSWTAVTTPVLAVKYSVAIDVEVDLDQDGVVDAVYDFDFSSNDYVLTIDGDTISMCIPRTDIAEDTDGDGIPDVLTGHATAKVKGLNPGKGLGRQNNLFSAPVEFDLQ